MQTGQDRSCFPAFDKEANDKIVAEIFKSSRKNRMGDPFYILADIKKDGKDLQRFKKL